MHNISHGLAVVGKGHQDLPQHLSSFVQRRQRRLKNFSKYTRSTRQPIRKAAKFI